MVPGIVLVLVGGLIAFSTYTNPAIVDLAAIAFGGGAALVLDEFALVFHLEDVYWEDEGRQSVVATVLGAAVIVLMLVLTAPAGLHTDTFSDRSRIYAVAYLGGNALFALICFLKGKPFVGLTSIFVPLDRPGRRGAARAPEVAVGALLLRRGQARARADPLLALPRPAHAQSRRRGRRRLPAPRSPLVRPGRNVLDRHEQAEHDAEQQVPERRLRECRGRSVTSVAAPERRAPGGSGR